MNHIWTLLLLFTGISGLLNAQDLLVVGTEWYYNLVFFGNGDTGVNRCYIDGDTTILDRTCLIYYQEHENCNGRPLKNYLYVDEDQVFFFDTDDTSFHLLYDFGLEAGDTMVYESGIHSWDLRRRTYQIVVDSIGTMDFNDTTLKVQHVTYLYPGDDGGWYESEKPDTIIEWIGSISNFFHFSDGTGFCDYQYSDILRCFSAPGHETVMLSETDCQFTPTRDLSPVEEYLVYPNPFSDYLHLEDEGEFEEPTILIYDLTGREVFRKNGNLSSGVNTIPVSQLEPSGYILHVLDSENRTIHLQKVVKIGR